MFIKNYLFSFSDRRQLVSNLSINRMNGKYKQPGEEHLNSICRSFKIPCHTPPESILPSVIERFDEREL